MDWRLFLEYLKVFLSAPAIAGVLGVAFLCVFKSNLKSLIDRTIRGRIGSFEWNGSQKERLEEPETSGDPPKLAENEPVELPSEIRLTPDQISSIQALLQSERANAILWEYRYLTLYLAPSTQRVLRWLSGPPSQHAVNFVESFLQTFVPEQLERAAIFRALQNHSLINIDGSGLISVTPKGLDYLTWRSN